MSLIPAFSWALFFLVVSRVKLCFITLLFAVLYFTLLYLKDK